MLAVAGFSAAPKPSESEQRLEIYDLSIQFTVQHIFSILRWPVRDDLAAIIRRCVLFKTDFRPVFSFFFHEAKITFGSV